MRIAARRNLAGRLSERGRAACCRPGKHASASNATTPAPASAVNNGSRLARTIRPSRPPAGAIGPRRASSRAIPCARRTTIDQPRLGLVHGPVFPTLRETASSMPNQSVIIGFGRGTRPRLGHLDCGMLIERMRKRLAADIKFIEPCLRRGLERNRTERHESHRSGDQRSC
jgi:hypothetical protein